MSNTIYFAGQHKLITELMAHPGVSFLVACSSNHPDQIVGWAAGSLMDGVLVLHYVLVKQTFRRLGVAARLVEKMGQLATVEGLVLCTHLSRDGWAIVKARPGWYHNPYLLYALHGGRKVDG
jgi:GNAT superfamily N-acetyltransferase